MPFGSGLAEGAAQTLHLLPKYKRELEDHLTSGGDQSSFPTWGEWLKKNHATAAQKIQPKGLRGG